MDYDLTNENIKDLKDLVLITTQIYDIYCDLIDLEIEGLKGSEDYTHGLIVLSDLLKQEKKIYKLYALDGHVLSEFLKYVGKNEGYIFFDALSDIKDGSSKSLVKQRILEKLTNLLNELASVDNLNYEEQEYKSEYVSHDFDINVMLDEQVKLDYLRTVLKILDLCLKDSNYQEIKHYLITYKYQLAFTLTNIEQELLLNKFEITENLYWGVDAVSQMEKITDEMEILNCQDYYGDNVLLDEAVSIIEMADIEKLEVYDIVEGILTSIYIRAALLFASPESIDNFEKTLKGDLKRKKIEPVVKQIIREIFNNSKSDRELVHRISIRNLTK